MNPIKQKKEECYYPNCKSKGVIQYGNKNGYYLLCQKHFNLVVFLRDLFDYFNENL